MTAGTNLKFKVWRYTWNPDDYVGGAQPTGSVAYSSVDARLHSQMPDQVLLQQGIETLRTFTATVRPGTLVIREEDEVEIVWPPHHWFYGQRFRVDGVQHSNFHPSEARSYLLLNLSRSVQAHGVQ